MTMLQLIMLWKFGSFLTKITLLYWSNHLTLQIWSLVTSLCIPNSRKSSKELVFKIQKPLDQPWRERSKRSRRNTSRSAWKSCRGDWKSAFEPKEITLKATGCKIYLSNKIKRCRPSHVTFQTYLVLIYFRLLKVWLPKTVLFDRLYSASLIEPISCRCSKCTILNKLNKE